jgi:23S rRNA (guanine745-N1)-methyltransferase
MRSRNADDAQLPPRTVAALLCSICGSRFVRNEHALRCERRHSFDVAKQGYVNLLHARVHAGTADTADMIAARADFLAAGYFAPLADRLAALAGEITKSGLIVDAGAGTGYYLARVLDEAPEAIGLALDVSAPALRRAARAHPRLGAAVWNLWEPWPVASGSAAVLLNVFAPRNGTEFHRVLAPGGTLIVASPGPDHLGELASLVGLLSVDREKERRLEETLAGRFRLAAREDLVNRVVLAPEDARRAVRMGPNAHHLHREGRHERLAGITEPVPVTTSFTISVYRRED